MTLINTALGASLPVSIESFGGLSTSMTTAAWATTLNFESPIPSSSRTCQIMPLSVAHEAAAAVTQTRELRVAERHASGRAHGRSQMGISGTHALRAAVREISKTA